MEIPAYEPEGGVPLVWDHGFVIDARESNGEVVVRANRAGLVSLARHLLVLAQDNVPSGSHVHLDDAAALEPGSTGLVLERDDSLVP